MSSMSQIGNDGTGKVVGGWVAAYILGAYLGGRSNEGDKEWVKGTYKSHVWVGWSMKESSGGKWDVEAKGKGDSMDT